MSEHKAFSERDVAVTLKGAEWFVLIAALANQPLSDQGKSLLRTAGTNLNKQITRAAR